MPTIQHDDVTLYYERKGQGVPVLLIQGVGVIGAGWGPQVEALSADCDCLTFDNRGLGKSSAGNGPLSIQQMAADALALMDAAGWQSAHVVGHSMGGVIAQQLALDAPRRVKSLSLLCTFSSGAEGARPTPRVIWLGIRARIGSPAMRRRAFLRMVFSQDYLNSLAIDDFAAKMAPVMGRDLAEQPPILMRQLKAMGAHDASAQLHTFASIPTLVVSAEHDPIALPQYGRRLAQLIPGSRYHEIPNASHAIPLQDPAQINALLHTHILQSETRS